MLVGPGDDAAVLALEPPVVATVDVLVEGVHFRRDWSSARDVGRKAVAVNVADLEAMGARASCLVVGFSAPASLEAVLGARIGRGASRGGRTAGVSLVGGDVTAARDITIAVTALGGLAGRAPVLRSGAEPGQLVAVRGRLGWAAAGLVVLGRGFRSPRVVVEAHRVPQVPYGAGPAAAAAGATAMIDVSDGLLADLGHVARASGVVIDIDRRPARDRRATAGRRRRDRDRPVRAGPHRWRGPCPGRHVRSARDHARGLAADRSGLRSRRPSADGAGGRRAVGGRRRFRPLPRPEVGRPSPGV